MRESNAYRLGAVHGFEWAADHTFTSAELRDVSRRSAETFIGPARTPEGMTDFMQAVLATARSDYMFGYRQAASGRV